MENVPSGEIDRTETDVGGERRTVLPPTHEPEAETHGTRGRPTLVPVPLTAVDVTQLDGNQHLDRFAEQLSGTPAEQLLGEPVAFDDQSALIDDDGGVGDRLEQSGQLSSAVAWIDEIRHVHPPRWSRMCLNLPPIRSVRHSDPNCQRSFLRE